jgi:outer membrane protein assembly factor BamB
VFAIAPATGTILWRLDAANAIGVPYEPGLYGGALDVSVFSRDKDTLVVMFEKRVFALDAQTGRVRWHVDPDTFPHSAFPLAHGGVVYLSSGPKRGKAIRGGP